MNVNEHAADDFVGNLKFKLVKSFFPLILRIKKNYSHYKNDLILRSLSVMTYRLIDDVLSILHKAPFSNYVTGRIF